MSYSTLPITLSSKLYKGTINRVYENMPYEDQILVVYRQTVIEKKYSLAYFGLNTKKLGVIKHFSLRMEDSISIKEMLKLSILERLRQFDKYYGIASIELEINFHREEIKFSMRTTKIMTDDKIRLALNKIRIIQHEEKRKIFKGLKARMN